MSDPAPSTREIDRFRDRADRFIADLDEEYYLHYAGLKDTLDVEQLYERYDDLTRLETAQSMEGAPTELWRFACEGFLGNLTREHQARLARVEAELEATVDGQTIPYRMLRVAMSNEPDRDKRRALEETRVRLLDENLNPVYLDAAQIDREAVQQLGARTTTSSTRASASGSTRSRTSAASCSTRPRSCGSAKATACSARGSGSGSPTRAPGTSSGSSARPSSTSSTRRTAWCPRSRRR